MEETICSLEPEPREDCIQVEECREQPQHVCVQISGSDL